MLCFEEDAQELKRRQQQCMWTRFFGMLPQEAAYETYNIHNILFNDRGDISLTLSPREKAN